MKTILTDNIKRYENEYLISIRNEIDEELKRRKEIKAKELQKMLDDFIDELKKDGFVARFGALTIRSGAISIEGVKESE